jgi:hypothetical protein
VGTSFIDRILKSFLLIGFGRRVRIPPRAAPRNPAPSEADKKKQPDRWPGRSGDDGGAHLHGPALYAERGAMKAAIGNG